MNVIVDTCVWSLALRRKKVYADAYVNELKALLSEGRVQMIGPIRQEILSGIRSDQQFEVLRDHLKAFPDMDLHTADYELAAEFFNLCREKGVQGSNTDFLICAIASRRELPILTTDKDFDQFKNILPINLHMPRALIKA